MWIVVAYFSHGYPTMFGPFDTVDEARKWGNLNPVTDLTDINWEIEPLNSPHEEGMEDNVQA